MRMYKTELKEDLIEEDKMEMMRITQRKGRKINIASKRQRKHQLRWKTQA